MKLESGKSYTIKQLFCGDNNKIIIPDLQRDYCWGNEDNNLVKGFIEGLIELNKEQPITMGMIYGYYNKYTPEHLQLCDGQQRLTTIFLILGVINRILGFSKFANYLMSSFEYHNDDQEPYLQYGIRESSLYFLSDLTVHYFLQDDIINIDDIKRQPWFLNEYILDPTINSIISAIRTVENALTELSDDDCEYLGDFITTKLEFLFYDMGNRENGEETFVVINTTGEPLTATQNLKPLVIEQNYIYNPKVASQWEEIETWFWRHRNIDTDYPHTSDEGLFCFLNLVRLLHCKTEEDSYNTIDNTDKFPYKEIPFSEVYDDFLIYSKLSEMDFSERYDKSIKYPSKQVFFQQDRLYAIVPTMAYCQKFKEASEEDIKRVYHLFSNMAKYRPVNRHKDDKDNPISPVFRTTEMIKDMQTADCLSLLNIMADKLEKVEEPYKLKFISAYQQSAEERKEIELLLAEAENHVILNGQVANLVEWSQFDKDLFRRYFEKFNSYWHIEDACRMDILRRALLTYEMYDYPLKLYSTFVNLGNKDTWLKIIQINSKEIRHFLDDERSLEEIIDNYENDENKWYPFVKNPSLVQFSEYKNSYVFGPVIIDMKKERTSSDYKVVYKSAEYGKNILGNKWYAIWANENCIWCDNCKYNLTMDSFIQPEGYEIVIWQGKNPGMESYPYFDQIGDIVISDNICLNKTESGKWTTGIINDASLAKDTYVYIAKCIDEKVCTPCN